MNYRIIFAPSFEADVELQVSYLAEQGVARHVIDAWFGKLSRRLLGLELWPRMYPVDADYSRAAGHTCRKVNFGDYLVFYRVVDEDRTVELIAFFSGKTDWKK